MPCLSAESSLAARPDPSARACALLWDESFLWGMMARQALREAGLPFDLVRAEEIRRGDLACYRMIFVPGGWASNKISALEERGCSEIRRFVEAGGSYLGICGGAGLATRDGIALLPVGRKPSSQRVTSFNGAVRVSPAAHPIWEKIGEPVFWAWWPSQLAVGHPEVRVLAAYGDAQPGAFSSDIALEEGRRRGWPEIEAGYGILLDPERLRGEAAVVEGRCGRGKVVLSMLHFDTPWDPRGRQALRNLWGYLAYGNLSGPEGGKPGPDPPPRPAPPDILDLLAEMRSGVNGLIALGEDLGLWRRRNPFLLQWRRGVRGLEYSTLDVMTREIGNRFVPGPPKRERSTAMSESDDMARLRRELLEISGLLGPFVARAGRLLMREQQSMQNAPLSPLRSDGKEIQALREELFGSAMSHGGAFKSLIDALDRLWLGLMDPREA